MTSLPRARAVAWVNWAGIGLTVVLFAMLAWSRRWMSDDGLIVLRTVRQLLAGNGPVFNPGERVESNTSTLWTATLTLVGWLPGVSLEWVAVITGLVFAVTGLLLALDGARRLYGGDGGAVLVVPAGALVVCALPPFRDFATSGLETGLITLWLGGSWWLLVRRVLGPGRHTWLAALVLGLGPLVRPDLAVFSLVGIVALLVLCWRGWLPALGWVGVAAALPVGYQVFRMGYYGLIVPNTALAKEAADTRWREGWNYLVDLFRPYLLWVALAALLLALVAGLIRVRAGRAVVVLTVAPVLAGALLGLYVVRVGGDFMHGRMLLPAVLCLLLPVMAVPLTRWSVVPVLGTAAWAVVAGWWLRPDYPASRPIDRATGIADERAYYVLLTRNEHPVTAQDYLPVTDFQRIVGPLRGHPRSVVVPESRAGVDGWVAYPAPVERSVVYVFNIGAAGMLLPLDVRVHDPIGLTSPLAAHSNRIPGGRIGHDKYLGYGFELADAGIVVLPEDSRVPIEELTAARRALRCPQIRELLESVRAPLTTERFLANLTGAPRRGAVRFSNDMFRAQACGDQS